MALTVRRIRDDELPAFIDTISTGFLERPDVNARADAMRDMFDLDRTWAAFEGGRMCGTLRSWGTELTIPGLGRLPGSAISAVTVLPTHRRRGVLRRVVTAEHAAIRERGEVVGLLYASEYPIYGRFGYGPACREATWTLETHATAFLRATAGTIELRPPDVSTRDAMIAVFDAWRVRRAGEIWRRPMRWDLELGLRPSGRSDAWKGFIVLHRDADGVVDGYARYSVADGAWVNRQPRTVLQVDDMHALSDDAYVGLWRYLADVDWVASVKAERRIVGERLPWELTNARAASVSDVGDGMWLRLFDVPRALEARTYAGEGSVVLDVVDDAAIGGRQRIRLEIGPDGTRCRPSKRAADLTLDVGALGAAYLGGVPLTSAVRMGGYDEHRAGTLSRLTAWMRTAEEPWCSSFF